MANGLPDFFRFSRGMIDDSIVGSHRWIVEFSSRSAVSSSANQILASETIKQSTLEIVAGKADAEQLTAIFALVSRSKF